MLNAIKWKLQTDNYVFFIKLKEGNSLKAESLILRKIVKNFCNKA